MSVDTNDAVAPDPRDADGSAANGQPTNPIDPVADAADKGFIFTIGHDGQRIMGCFNIINDLDPRCLA